MFVGGRVFSLVVAWSEWCRVVLASQTWEGRKTQELSELGVSFCWSGAGGGRVGGLS
jgi:hypothetical protein